MAADSSTELTARPPAERRLPALLAMAGAILWLALATVLQLLRQDGLPATDTIWAEDGHLFLTAALNVDPALGLVGAQAGGYMHAVPRLLAAGAAALPVRTAAPFLAISSAAIVGALSLVVYRASTWLIPNRLGRAALAGLMVLLPAAGVEAMNNTANLHYYFIFASFWALTWRPSNVAWTSISALVVLLAATSDPTTILLAPIAVWAIFRRRAPRELLVAGALLSGLLLQGLVVLAGEGDEPYRGVAEPLRSELAARSFAPRAYGGSDPLEIPGLFGLRVVTGFALGDRLLTSSWERFGSALGIAGLLVLAGLVLLHVARSGTGRRGPPLMVIAYVVAFFVLPVAIRGTEHMRSGEMLSFTGSRFVIVPMLLLASFVIAMLSPRAAPGPNLLRRGLAAALIVWMAVVMVMNYRVANGRSGGPRWSDELAASTAACRSATFARPRTPPPWGAFDVIVPCERIPVQVGPI